MRDTRMRVRAHMYKGYCACLRGVVCVCSGQRAGVPETGRRRRTFQRRSRRRGSAHDADMTVQASI